MIIQHEIDGERRHTMPVLSLWVLIMELASCHPFGAQNFEVAPRVLENLCPHTHLSSTNTIQSKYG
jgi:hypothetical protein